MGRKKYLTLRKGIDIEMVGVQVISQAIMSMIHVCGITENCFVNSSQGATMYM